MAAENTNANGPDPARSSDSSFREWLIGQSGLVLGAYVSVLAVLAYPACFIVFSMQLIGYYGFNYWTAVNAASLVPATLVVSKLAAIFFFSLFTNGAVWTWCIFVWGYKKVCRAAYNSPDNPLGLEDPDRPRGRKTITLGQLLFSWQRYTHIGITLLIPMMTFPAFFPTSRFTLSIYAAYLILVALGSYITTPVMTKAIEDESRPKLYTAVCLAYAMSILAAVPLVGIRSPALPTVEMTWDGQTQEVSQLSHSDGYWHVIKGSTLLSIKDDDVEGVVTVTGVTEKPGY